MSTDQWYERYAWVWFAVIAAVGLVTGLLVFVNPAVTTSVWAQFGHELPAAVAADAAAGEYVQFISHWASTGTVGFDLFGLLIAVTAFRRSERWAWLAFWYWPVLFATHFVTYQSRFRYGQLVWLTISVAALLGTYRQAWAPTVAVPSEVRA
jgi:hypothetical protein